MGLLLTFVLVFSTSVWNITNIGSVHEVSANMSPKVTINNLTLYESYNTYQIKFKNLSKNADITFRSSKSKIAKVSNAGIITPNSKGRAIITVTIKQNGKKYISKLNVTVKIPNIKFTSRTNELNKGEKFIFNAKSYGIDGDITWSVSDDSIATINKKTGELKAVSEGVVDVIATVGFITSSCTVSIIEKDPVYMARPITSIYYDFTITGISKDTLLKFHMLCADNWLDYYGNLNISNNCDYSLYFNDIYLTGLKNIGYFEQIPDTTIKVTLNKITINGNYVLDYNKEVDVSSDKDNGYANIWNSWENGVTIIADCSDAYLAYSSDDQMIRFYAQE